MKVICSLFYSLLFAASLAQAGGGGDGKSHYCGSFRVKNVFECASPNFRLSGRVAQNYNFNDYGERCPEAGKQVLRVDVVMPSATEGQLRAWGRNPLEVLELPRFDAKFEGSLGLQLNEAQVMLSEGTALVDVLVNAPWSSRFGQVYREELVCTQIKE